MQYQAVEMSKISDALTNSVILYPEPNVIKEPNPKYKVGSKNKGGAMVGAEKDEPEFLTTYEDTMKKAIDAAEALLKKKLDKKKTTAALEAIKKYPLVDLNWLLALAEHYKVFDDKEWHLFKRQQIAESRQRGEDQNEEMIALKRADHTKMSEMITKL